jgi:zinc transport system ATP-binding protein
MTPVLQAHEVSVPGRLRALSLTVNPGEIHGLVGANGSGKSTFLECILGAVPFEGRLERSDSVAFVPQVFSVGLLPVTVLEWLAASRTNRPVWLGVQPSLRLRLEQALERMNCKSLADAAMSSLSQGQLRRVALADALDRSPALLLLDEPEAGLDANSTRLLLTELTEACSRGVGVLLVSHHEASLNHLHARRTQVEGLE